MKFGRSKKRGATAERYEDASPHLQGDAIVALDHVSRIYGRGKSAIHALRDVSESFSEGTFTAIMGPSGSGKSTFIQCAAGLDTPSKGRVIVGNQIINVLKEPSLTELRRRHIGFVFQAFNLLPALTAKENIVLPMALDRRRPDDAWLSEIVSHMGIGDLLGSRPTELSGGQQQRVAIARAIVSRPDVVFADEPTGALDARSARATMELLRHTVDTFGQTLILVTHDPVAASYADRVLLLADGEIADRMPQSTAESIAMRLAGLELR